METKAKTARLLRKLDKAISSLDGTSERMIARRNARARVLAALRAVRAHVDREFPAIVSRVGTTRLTYEGRRARLVRKGWARSTPEAAGFFAAAGVTVKFIRGKDRAGNDMTDGPWVPKWAKVIGHTNQAQLRAAQKSVKIRQAVLAADALTLD